MALSTFSTSQLLHHFGGDDPHATRAGQAVRQPYERLFQDELYGIAIDHLDPLHGSESGIGLELLVRW